MSHDEQRGAINALQHTFPLQLLQHQASLRRFQRQHRNCQRSVSHAVIHGMGGTAHVDNLTPTQAIIALKHKSKQPLNRVNAICARAVNFALTSANLMRMLVSTLP